MSLNFEELRPILRPTSVHYGVMKIDKDKCVSCGRCITNFPFKCFEMVGDNFPVMKENHCCFSCYNCIIACHTNAISIVDSYHVDDGYYASGSSEPTMPKAPFDGNGSAAAWTEVERTILERRSVRNFKDEKVSDELIRRVLEAGRFAPSAGNNQPWKFTVVTDKEFISVLEDASYAVLNNINGMFRDDEKVMGLVEMFGGAAMHGGAFEPRAMGGMECVARKDLPVFLSAPVVIFLGGHERMIEPALHAGITGQNMNLAANSLGLGCCWCSFSIALNFIPELRSTLGMDDPWKIQTALLLGYPKFKQEGMVPRQSRPVMWFGDDGHQ